MTLTEAFAGLGDPRTGPARRHDLKEMILMALCAVLCGADTWVDVAEWAEDNEAWLKRYLRLEHGTPSHDTFGRLFRLLDAKVFEACFREWISDLAGGWRLRILASCLSSTRGTSGQCQAAVKVHGVFPSFRG